MLYELLFIAIVIFAAIVFAIKSRYFDRFLNWVLKGTPKRNADDFSRDEKSLGKERKDRKKQLLNQSGSINKEIKKL